MKQIDEVQLLLAVGEVGDDLLLRAEQRPASSLRRVRHRWGGALAACLCLALVLTAALQLPGMFRMGSSENSAAMAGASDGSGVPDSENGLQYGREHDEIFDSAAVQNSTNCLCALGIAAAADIAEITTDGQGGRKEDGAEQEEYVRLFYDALAGAAVLPAKEDSGAFSPSATGALHLSSGEELAFCYDPSRCVLELENYHFQNADFSLLLGGV